MSTDKMPDGWTRVTFGDVVRNVNENSRDLASDGLDRVVGLDHLDPGSLYLKRYDSLESLPDGTTFTRKFKPGQVLFGKRRAYQRKVAVPDFEGVCSGDILVFEPADKRMLTGFLPYLVQSDGFFDHALGTSAGSLSPRTKWAELAKYEFALPPIDEQRRILEVLEHADAVLESWRSAENATSVLVDAKVKQLALTAGEEESVLITEVADLQPGRQLSPAHRRSVRPVAYLRAANLKLDRVDLEDIKTMDFTAEDEARYRVRKDDILLVEGGDPDKVGAPCFVDFESAQPLCIQNTVIRVRLRRESYDARFLYWYLRARFVNGDLERLATGTKLYHLGVRKVEGLRVPLMAKERQVTIAIRLDRSQSLLVAVREQVEAVARLRSGLIESLLIGRLS